MTSQPHNVAGAAGAAGLRTVGPYTLLAKIGEGGMGVVHLARRGDGPRVALKVLRSHIVGDDEARQRLAREVASLQRIRSRWVAEIVDADPWAEVPYVATRYVPGLSLHDHAQQEGPIVGADLLWFAGSLAEGLAAVHAAGVLHRDVKPSNVLMEGRTPIVIDFGLARVADDPRLTHTGWLLGTPGYLAPEILYGDDASPASDLHSWGATVAFAATGRAPFGRGPSMAIMDRVRRGEHDLTGLEGPLLDVVTATLDPEPTRRPTLEAVLAWLRPQTTRPAPVLAPPPTSPPTSGPGPARHVDDVDPFDAALALAAPSTDRAVDPAVDWTAAPTLAEPPQRDGVTRILAEVPPTVVEPRFAPPAPVYAPAPLPYLAAPVVERPPLAERARRLLLVAAGALVTGAACMVGSLGDRAAGRDRGVAAAQWLARRERRPVATPGPRATVVRRRPAARAHAVAPRAVDPRRDDVAAVGGRAGRRRRAGLLRGGRRHPDHLVRVGCRARPVAVVGAGWQPAPGPAEPGGRPGRPHARLVAGRDRGPARAGVRRWPVGRGERCLLDPGRRPPVLDPLTSLPGRSRVSARGPM